MPQSEKQSTVSNGRGGKRPGAGRPKGSLDKGNAAIREMIVEALHGVGGVSYLENLAHSTPTAFAALLGKVLPLQVTGADGGDIGHRVTIEVVGVAPPR